MTAELERLISIPQAAKQAGRSRRQFLRSVLALHAEDVAGKADATWLVVRRKPGGRQVLRVNMGRLRAAHPGWFMRRWVDPSDILERLENVERRSAELETSHSSLRARVRVLEHAAKVRAV